MPFHESRLGYANGALVSAELLRNYLLEEIVMDRTRLDIPTTLKGAALAGAAAAVSLGIAVAGAGTAVADTDDNSTATSRQSTTSSSRPRAFGRNPERNHGTSDRQTVGSE